MEHKKLCHCKVRTIIHPTPQLLAPTHQYYQIQHSTARDYLHVGLVVEETTTDCCSLFESMQSPRQHAHVHV